MEPQCPGYSDRAKPGDRVYSYGWDGEGGNPSANWYQGYGTVVVADSTQISIRKEGTDNSYWNMRHGWYRIVARTPENEKRQETVTDGGARNTNDKQPPMDLIKSLIGLNKSEPEATFEALGITDDRDVLTQAGRELFVQFMFRDPAMRAAFAEKVAAPILEAKRKAEAKK